MQVLCARWSFKLIKLRQKQHNLANKNVSLWLLKTVIARSVEQLCGLNAIKDNVY